MAIGDRVISQTEFSLELAHGGDGDSGTDFTATDFMMVMDFMMAMDFMMVMDLTVMDSLGADSTAGRDLEIGQASPTVADSVVDLPAVEVAASQAAAFTAGEASTEVEAVSMVAVVVDSMEVAVVVGSMEVAADMAAATGN